jgi:DNA-binding IclR family transcriptional regulator
MLSPERILRMAGGLRASEVLFSGLELGLFTELGKGPRSLGQLAPVLGLDERAAAGFLDALVTLGLISRDGSGLDAIYVNTREAGHFLDRKSPAYIGAQLAETHARVAKSAR